MAPDNGAISFADGAADLSATGSLSTPTATPMPLQSPAVASQQPAYQAPDTISPPAGYPQPAYPRPYASPVANSIYTPVPAGGRFFVKDPTGLTRALTIMLWICAGITVVSMLPELGMVATLTQPPDPSLAVFSLLTMATGILQMVSRLVTVVMFCKWIHRANTNVRGFGAQGMEFTPEWAVGWFFVPFLNLVRPYQAMSEIWRASRNPDRWQTEPLAKVVSNWWAMFLIANVTSNFASRLSFGAKTPDELKNALYVTLVSDVLEVLSAIVAIMLVKDVVQKQIDYIEYRS